MNKYSVVFMPDTQTIEQIKQMKLQLADKIGWFNSKNSLAHFTIFEFLEEGINMKRIEKQLERIEKQLERIASEIEPFHVKCTNFNSFENGAFFIQPNQDSSKILTLLMKQVLLESHFIKKTITNTTPHLSIGRRLNDNQLQAAQKIFTEIELSFEIDQLTLRIFDEKQRQFKIYKQFPLLGNSKEIQGSLF